MRMIIRHLIFVTILLFHFVLEAKVEIVSPRNNTTQLGNTIFIVFNKDVYSKNYTIQIATNNTFSVSSLESSFLTTDNIITKTFTNNGTYYIRAKGNYDVNWSDIVQVNIIDLKTNPDLISWFKADTSDITLSGSNSVNTWTDFANNSRLAAQTNIPQMPTLVRNVRKLNNNNVLSFNGNSALPTNMSLSAAINANTDYTCLAVLNYSSANPNAVQYFLAGGACGFYSELKAFNGGFGVYGQFSTGIYSPLSELSSDYSIINYSSTYLERNQRNISPLGVITSPNGKNMSMTSIGMVPGYGSLSYQGELAEMIFYKNLADSVTKANAYAYLRTKYAPPVNLGLDTVFGSSFSDTLQLSTDNRFARYLWSNGDTTPTTKVLSSGTYKLTTTDIFGFQSQDEISVYPYKRLKGATLNVCPNDSIVINLGLDPSYAILWSNGVTQSTVVLKNPGQYTVRITKNSKVVWDTVNITKNLDLTPLSYLPGRDQNNIFRICGGEKIYIKNDSLFNSFVWSTGSTTNAGTTYNTGNVYINYIERNGCKLTDTLSVVVTGQAPVANFTTSSICLNKSTLFNDISTNPVGATINSWKWNFSDGDSARVQNPTKTFSALGTIAASLKVTSNQGCSDSIYRTLSVNKNPVASFYNLLSCSGKATTFVDQTNPNSSSVVNWAWDFGGLGVINGTQNPSFTFPTAGVYNIKLLATNSNGCIDTITSQTKVNPSPVANFSYDSVCGKSPVTLKFLASVQSPSVIPDINWGNWDFGDGQIETAIRNPQHVYAEPGAYNVMLIVKSSEQCIDTTVKRIRIFDYPNVDFTVSPTQCIGKQILFSDISSTPDGTPMAKWNWYFSGLATDTAQNPRYTFNTQGNYTIQLTARNAVGCSGTKLRSIAVSAPPTPKFTFSPQYGLPPLNVVYTNQSPTSGNYIWSYGDGSPLVQGYNPPQHVYTTIGSYPIKLIATDFRGCTDTLTKYILVDKAYLDGVMASISIIPDGDFYKIQATIINNSNIEITSMGLSLQLGGGAVIRENWYGSLLPGQTTVYLFTGEIKVGENNQVPVVCASIDNINNNAREDRTDNNTTCKEVAVGSFSILNIYPNPANDNINFGIMLPKDGKVNIRFVDLLGQLLYNKDFDGSKGYNQLVMPVSLLNAAVYVAEITFDGEIAREKFMVKNKK